MSIHEEMKLLRAELAEAKAQSTKWQGLAEVAQAGWDICQKAAERMDRVRKEADERAEAERDSLRALLKRLRDWDMMDIAADGKYWRQEIITALSGSK